MRESDYSWRRLLGVSSADLYAVTDATRVRRIGGIFWLCGGLIAALMLPFAPPDESSLGGAGWPVAAVIVLGAVACGWALFADLARFRLGWPAILFLGYVGVALTTVLNWLSGSDAPYSELLLIGALYVAASFPPRVLPPYMVAVAVALLVPLAWEADLLVIEQVARLLIWSGLGLAVSTLLARQRLERAALMEREERAALQARADPLTGLGNRRAFDEALEMAGQRAARTDRRVSVIIADVADFKAVNDTFGLIAGDGLLRDVATRIEATVRAPDACFRWGGDEFVILADVDGTDAASFAERLSEAVGRSCTRPDGQPVRLHIGIAELEPRSDPDEILNTASRAMKPARRRRG